MSSTTVPTAVAPPTPPPMPTTIDWTRLSLGTFKVRGPSCSRVVCAAVQLGYRRIDSATVYRNEAEVAAALRDSGVDRALVHLTSKLGPAQMESEGSALAAVRLSLELTRLEYLDCYLIHWPGRGGWKPPDPRHAAHRVASWRGLERAHTEGLVRTIGLSNFELRHLRGLESVWTVRPCVNQIEMHPLIYRTQLPTVEWCRARGIAIQAYAPLGSGSARLLAHELVMRIAKECAHTPAQVLLKWALQHDFEVLPKTATIERLTENALACDREWSLSDEHMRLLDDMEHTHGTQRFCWDPSTIA